MQLPSIVSAAGNNKQAMMRVDDAGHQPLLQSGISCMIAAHTNALQSTAYFLADCDTFKSALVLKK